jgi:hypothetical protein
VSCRFRTTRGRTVDNAGTFAVQIAANSSVNVAQVAGTTTDTNSGVKSAGTQRIVLATDQPQLTNALKVDGSAVTQPVSGTVTANLGTAAVTNAGTFAVQDSEKIADDAAFTVATTKLRQPHGRRARGHPGVRAALGRLGGDHRPPDHRQLGVADGGRAGRHAGLRDPTPSATGGWSKIKYAAQTTTVQTPKGTAGTFGGYYIYNPNASVAYVQVFDAATATTITLGTTVPDMIFAIPASVGGEH